MAGRHRTALPTRDHSVDQRRKFSGLVFLQKMPGALNCRMWLPPSARNARLEQFVAAARDRIAIAERGEERFVEPLQLRPSLFVFSC